MTACFHCKKELDTTARPGRGEGCPSCGSDVKVCLNCRFYDRDSYNECSEPSADRVVDKAKANFCEFFEFGSDKAVSRGKDPLSDLKGLFKS